MLEDAELLRRYVADRSEAAFAELVRRHLNLVYSAAWRRVGGDAHLAEDVAQKVFAALARQAASLNREVVLAGWLYTAARYSAAQVVRTETRRRRREEEAHIMNERFASSTPDPEWERLRPLLDEMMDRLGERDREALLMRFFEGRPFAELGAKLQLSEDAARKRVDRALEKLRTLLAEQGVTSTGAAITALLANQTVFAAPSGLAAVVTGSALSAASAMTGSGLFFLQSVKASHVLVGVVGILAAVAVAVAIREDRARDQAETALVTVQRDYAALLAEQREMKAQTSAVEQEIARRQKSVETQAAPRGDESRIAAEPRPAPNTPAWNPAAEGEVLLKRYPELKQALIQWSDGLHDSQWGLLHAQLGLTPAQIDAFHSLLRGSNSLSLSIGNEKPVKLALENSLPRSAVEHQMRELLGPDGYRHYFEYTKTWSARALAMQAAGNLAFIAPLTTEDTNRLVQIIVECTQPSDTPRSHFGWDEVITRAGQTFSAPQLAVLERMRSQLEFDEAKRQAKFARP